MARKTKTTAEQSGGENPELKLTEYHNKRVAFYDNWVRAWIDSRIERDRQLLILSYLAIGGLIGIFGIPKEMLKIIFWVGTFVSFLICIGCLLIIFTLNAGYAKAVLEAHRAEGRGAESEAEASVLREKAQEKEEILSKLTGVVIIFFGIGVILGIVFIIMNICTMMKG